MGSKFSASTTKEDRASIGLGGLDISSGLQYPPFSRVGKPRKTLSTLLNFTLMRKEHAYAMEEIFIDGAGSRCCFCRGQPGCSAGKRGSAGEHHAQELQFRTVLCEQYRLDVDEDTCVAEHYFAK